MDEPALLPLEFHRLRLDAMLHVKLISSLRVAREGDAAKAACEAALMVRVSAELHKHTMALTRPGSAIGGHITQLASMTSDLWDYARARSDELVLELEPLHLRHWLSRFENDHTMATRDSRSALRIEFAPSAPERVMADPARLARLLSFWISDTTHDLGPGPFTLAVDSINPTHTASPKFAERQSVRFTVHRSAVVLPGIPESSASGTRRERTAMGELRARLAEDLRALMTATLTAHALVVPLEIVQDQAHTGYLRLLPDASWGAAVAPPAEAAAPAEVASPAAVAPPDGRLTLAGEEAIDFVYLDRQLGSLAPIILARTAPAYLTAAGGRLTALYVAHDLNEPSPLHALAHAWRGSALTVGARHLAQLLEAVEKQSAAGHLPGQGQMTLLGEACDQLAHALQSYLSRQPTPVQTPCPAMRQRILLVEREPEQTVYWSVILTSLGFEVVAASSVTEANALLAAGPHIVVCSSLFADGRGVDFVKALRKHAEFGLTYLILLSSSYGQAEVIESLHSGANDCMAKDATYGEVRARIELAERVIALNGALHRKSAELSEALAVIQTELLSAARLQAAILPKAMDYKGTQIRTIYVPSDTLGGDMLGANLVDEDRIAFGLIDIAGHGTASALISCSLMRELMDRMTSLLQDAPGKNYETCGQLAIAQMNRHYCRLNLPGFYFTALAGVLDLRLGTASYCQAGHPSLLSFDTVRGWIELEDAGFPVGLLEEATYVQRLITLVPGQMLLAISDGFLRPSSDDAGGTQALLRALRHAPTDTAAIIAQLNCFATEVRGPERDDQSAMVIYFAAPILQPAQP